MRLFKIIILILLACSLSSCGFRLRGYADMQGNSALPFESILLTGGGGTLDSLRRQLAAFRDAKEVRKAEEAEAGIAIMGEGVDRQILTVNRAGRVSEYRVYLNVSFRISYQGKTLLEDGNLRIFRDYSYTDSAILGKESEQTLLVRDMYQDAANQILRRATALIRNEQKRPQNASDVTAATP